MLKELKNLLGKDHFILATELLPSTTKDTIYQYYEDGKVYQYNALFDIDIPVFDASKQANETWTETGTVEEIPGLGTVNAPYTINYTCIQNGTSKEVSGTTYDDVYGLTYNIELDLSNHPDFGFIGKINVLTITSYYAFEVGLIEYDQTDNGQSQGQLPSYTLLLIENGTN